MKMRKLMIAFAATGLASSVAQAGPAAGVSQACRTEVQTLCPKTGDKQARRACMMEKRGQVSEGCRAEIRAAREKLRAAKQAKSMSTAPATTEN
jgi:hypothetical protein